MKKSINYLHILFVEICIFLLPLSAWGQQRVVISPFYSDYALLTDSLPSGWSLSPYIQLGVKVEFPQQTTLSSLQQYQFENSSYFSAVLRPFIPVTLQYGKLRWNNLNLTNWNTPEIEKQELQYMKTVRGRFSLSYNDCSFIAGNLFNSNGIPSFSYIHYEGWGTLFPTNTQRTDTTTYVFHVNPSLFYLLTDKGLIDLYTTESITVPPHEKFPSLFFFYRPVYEHKTIEYKGFDITLVAENEKLATQLYHKLSPDTIRKSFDKGSLSTTESVPDDSVIYRALKAIDCLANLSNDIRQHIAIVKTGLNFEVKMGKAENLDNLSAHFSLTLDSVLLMDQKMYYQHTLLHEMLHFVIGKQQIRQKNLPAQETNFFAESTTEYLAKYLFGKYITHEKMFTDSIEHSPINLTMIKKAKRSIQSNHSISVGADGSDETANTAWVYYDLLPVLLHQLAVNNQVDEEAFAKAVYRYARGIEKQPQSLQHFFSYLKKQGFHLKGKQKKYIYLVLNKSFA